MPQVGSLKAKLEQLEIDLHVSDVLGFDDVYNQNCCHV